MTLDEIRKIIQQRDTIGFEGVLLSELDKMEKRVKDLEQYNNRILDESLEFLNKKNKTKTRLIRLLEAVERHRKLFQEIDDEVLNTTVEEIRKEIK